MSIKSWLAGLWRDKRAGKVDKDAGVIPGKKAVATTHADTHTSLGRNAWRRRYWMPVYRGGYAYLRGGGVYEVRADGWRRVAQGKSVVIQSEGR